MTMKSWNSNNKRKHVVLSFFIFMIAVFLVSSSTTQGEQTSTTSSIVNNVSTGDDTTSGGSNNKTTSSTANVDPKLSFSSYYTLITSSFQSMTTKYVTKKIFTVSDTNSEWWNDIISLPSDGTYGNKYLMKNEIGFLDSKKILFVCVSIFLFS
jgi:hypothetical protein